MKRITIIDCAIVFAVFATLVPTAKAHGSSHPPQSGSDGGSMMDAQVAPRALIWSGERLWQTVEGTILVCPEGNTIGDYQWRDQYCFNDKIKGEGKQTRWIPLQSYAVQGMVLKSYEYRFVGSGGGKVLITYYGPATQPVAAGLKGETTVVSPTFTGPITINADKVTVQRKKK